MQEMTHSERTPILGVDPWNDELIIGDEYNIVGIQTSNYEVVKYDHCEKVAIRILLKVGQKPRSSYVLIEIFSNFQANQPKFSHNSDTYQLVVLKNCQFHGMRTSMGLSVFNFKLEADHENTYIWLSNDRPDFWRFPNEFFDQNGLSPGLSWNLDRSKNSVFGTSVTSEDRKIDARTGYGLTPCFRDLSTIQLEMIKGRLEKLVIVDGCIAHSAIKYDPPMHMYVQFYY